MRLIGTLKKEYDIQLILKSPMHISSGTRQGGYNAILRTSSGPIVPASAIKGKARDNFSKLVQSKCESKSGNKYCTCPVCSIFGGTGYQPARIIIEDFLFVKQDNADVPISIRPNVAIDRYRKVAKDQALVFNEVLSKGVFHGRVQVYFTPETIQFEKELKLSFKMIEAIGTGKSRGLGFVHVEVKDIE
ncbi:MAG TPA: RAMP superfamily protein [Clostridiaceae bacterium]|nr:RAMP superfamily protein [Clostridiaceae bacterium]